jgi:hypothetical protein
MQAYAKEVMNGLVKKITTDKVVKYARYRLFSDDIPSIPRFKWSRANQFVLLLEDTFDARGYKQWASVGRTIKKGAKAIHILAPNVISRDKLDEKGNPIIEKGKPVQDKFCVGFRTINVFKVEDTEGEPLNYDENLTWDIGGLKIKGKDIESLPLINIARALNVNVQFGFTDGFLEGYFSTKVFSNGKEEKVITLGTDEKIVFLHELSHAIDSILPGQNNEKEFKEVVAELSAAFLASFYNVSFNLDNVKAYIEVYTGKKHVFQRITEALDRVEEIAEYVFAFEEKK